VGVSAVPGVSSLGTRGRAPARCTSPLCYTSGFPTSTSHDVNYNINDTTLAWCFKQLHN